MSLRPLGVKQEKKKKRKEKKEKKRKKRRKNEGKGCIEYKRIGLHSLLNAE